MIAMPSSMPVSSIGTATVAQPAAGATEAGAFGAVMASLVPPPPAPAPTPTLRPPATPAAHDGDIPETDETGPSPDDEPVDGTATPDVAAIALDRPALSPVAIGVAVPPVDAAARPPADVATAGGGETGRLTPSVALAAPRVAPPRSPDGLADAGRGETGVGAGAEQALSVAMASSALDATGGAVAASLPSRPSLAIGDGAAGPATSNGRAVPARSPDPAFAGGLSLAADPGAPAIPSAVGGRADGGIGGGAAIVTPLAAGPASHASGPAGATAQPFPAMPSAGAPAANAVDGSGATASAGDAATAVIGAARTADTPSTGAALVAGLVAPAAAPTAADAGNMTASTGPDPAIALRSSAAAPFTVSFLRGARTTAAADAAVAAGSAAVDPVAGSARPDDTRTDDALPPVPAGLAVPPANAPVASSADAAAGAVAASPADTLHHHLDVAHDGAWLDRLARDIAASADRDQKMRFQLNPERLGSLHVEIGGGDGGASVRFTADSEAARALLADAQPRLVAEARAQGMRIADTQVDLSGQAGGRGDGQGGGGQAGANPFTQGQRQSQGDGRRASPFDRPAQGRAATRAGAVNAGTERYA